MFVNQHGDLYDQGLAFGGVNGVAVKNISGEYITLNFSLLDRNESCSHTEGILI